LQSAEGKVPTPLGPVLVTWENGNPFKLMLALPPKMSAQVELPAGEKSTGVFVNGQSVRARRDGLGWILEQELVGEKSIEVR